MKTLIKTVLILVTFVITFFITTIFFDAIERHTGYYDESISESGEIVK